MQEQEGNGTGVFKGREGPARVRRQKKSVFFAPESEAQSPSLCSLKTRTVFAVYKSRIGYFKTWSKAQTRPIFHHVLRLSWHSSNVQRKHFFPSIKSIILLCFHFKLIVHWSTKQIILKTDFSFPGWR